MPLSDVLPTLNVDKFVLECMDSGMISISADPVAIKTDMTPWPIFALELENWLVTETDNDPMTLSNTLPCRIAFAMEM